MAVKDTSRLDGATGAVSATLMTFTMPAFGRSTGKRKLRTTRPVS